MTTTVIIFIVMGVVAIAFGRKQSDPKRRVMASRLGLALGVAAVGLAVIDAFDIVSDGDATTPPVERELVVE